jgi:hypothetical protein
MPNLARTRACLRIFGDDLIPEEITEKLGHKPTKQELKGEEISLGKTGRVRTAITGAGAWKQRNQSPVT